MFLNVVLKNYLDFLVFMDEERLSFRDRSHYVHYVNYSFARVMTHFDCQLGGI